VDRCPSCDESNWCVVSSVERFLHLLRRGVVVGGCLLCVFCAEPLNSEGGGCRWCKYCKGVQPRGSYLKRCVGCRVLFVTRVRYKKFHSVGCKVVSVKKG